jgi:hypothetical protein
VARNTAVLISDALSSGGRPLEPALRTRLEQEFGYDFGRVRIHTGVAAARSAEAVSARAYTLGWDIVFGIAEYAPHTSKGLRLLAHELSHVVQQTSYGQYFVQRQANPAAVWIAAGSLGWNVINAALQNNGDVTYGFEKMEGVKFPNDDVDGYKTQHKYPIARGHQEVAFWFGTSGSRKSGIKYAIDYEHDGYSIGGISMEHLDTYDWPLWSGSFTVSIVPQRELSGDAATVRITTNGSYSRMMWTSGGGSAVFQLSGDNDFTLVSSSEEPWVELNGSMLVAGNELQDTDGTAVATAGGGDGSSASDGSGDGGSAAAASDAGASSTSGGSGDVASTVGDSSGAASESDGAAAPATSGPGDGGSSTSSA